MKKKILSVILICLAVMSVFASCNKKPDVPPEENTAVVETNPDNSVYVSDPELSFRFAVPRELSPITYTGSSTSMGMLISASIRNGYDNDGNYVITNSNKNILFGVSKYYANEVYDYDSKRIDLSKLKSAQDIFNALRYKVQISFENSGSDLVDKAKINKFDVKSEAEQIVKTGEKSKELKVSYFEGTATLSTGSQASVYGYSIAGDNPVIMYILDFNDKPDAVQNKKTLDEVLASFSFAETPEAKTKN